MDTQKSARSTHPNWHFRMAALLAILAFVSLLALTLPDPLDTAGVVCSAVCHRAPEHTIRIGERLLPLCARCTGTFVGTLFGLIGQFFLLGRRRESSFPPFRLLAVMGLFSALWAADGVNSFLAWNGAFHFYEPQNWLRLTTGALHGLTVSGVLLPLINYSLWTNPTGGRTIGSWRDLGILALLEVGLVALVLIDWSPLLYPLGFLSAAGVLTTLTAINAVLAMMVLRWENRYRSFWDARVPLLLGFFLALLEIGAMDLIRLQVTGSLVGVPGL
jgi:uncharacterized membrane protein